MQGELVNPIVFNNRNVRLKCKMCFISSFYEKGIYSVEHIMNNGHIRPLQHSLNRGMTSAEFVKIIDIYNAIPENLKNEEVYEKFQQVDLIHFEIELKISGRKYSFRGIPSRKIYATLVSNLQNSYTLQIKDGPTKFQYAEEEMKKIFVRPRSTTILSKQREFQFMLLHGVVNTKEKLF